MNAATTTLSGANISLALFLETLLAEGRAVVSPGPIQPADESVGSLLAETEAKAREELAGGGPGFCQEAAIWAADLLYRICRLVVCRDLGDDEVAAAFARQCPAPRGPETDWSADLMLRHLPALFGLARHLSNADPLVAQIRALGKAWPLSSVGMPDLSGMSLDSFIGHPSLARLYVDRITAANDLSRLGDPRVDDLVRADLGAHRELAPLFASRLYPA